MYRQTVGLGNILLASRKKKKTRALFRAQTSFHCIGRLEKGMVRSLQVQQAANAKKKLFFSEARRYLVAGVRGLS